MSYILIPEQNYCGGINFYSDIETAGYELNKSYSTDTKEFSKLSGISNLYFNFPSVAADGTQALLFWSYNYNGSIILETSSDPDFETISPMIIQSSYGIFKRLIVYSNQGSLYYRIKPTGADIDLIKVNFGRLIQIPENFRVRFQSKNLKYENSTVYNNLLGQIRYDGFENNGIQASYKLEFNYLDEQDRDLLVEIFKLGKGCLPLWFIEDVQDEESWALVEFKELQYEEPAPGYFNISISVEGF